MEGDNHNGTHNASQGKYNVHTIIGEEEGVSGEIFTAEITDDGVIFDHSFVEGGTFISHDEFEDLDEFRQEFLDEIDP